MNFLSKKRYENTYLFYKIIIERINGGILVDYLSSNSVLLSQKSLDFLWQKQKVILGNIANTSTPGYKAKYVTFEEELRGRISSMKNRKESDIRKEILEAKTNIHTTEQESTRLDGNNVNADVENLELARTGLQYEFVLKSINDDFTRLRSAIRG